MAASALQPLFREPPSALRQSALRAVMRQVTRQASHRLRTSLVGSLLGMVMLLGMAVGVQPAWASLTNNAYDGNIYALYAGNGSLVPPRSSLAQAMADHRAAAVIYYLDDDAASKQFSPVVSELQRLWGNNIELIPLVTDPLQNRTDAGTSDPAHYWKGEVPQVVVFSPEGKVLLDESGPVPLRRINEALSQATGIALPEELAGGELRSFNELNAEVVSQ